MLAAVIQFQIYSSSNHSYSDSNHHLETSPSDSIWWNSQWLPDSTGTPRPILTHDTRPALAVPVLPAKYPQRFVSPSLPASHVNDQHLLSSISHRQDTITRHQISYFKKIIISKHISPPGGEPNLTTYSTNYYSSKKKDPAFESTRSEEHPTAHPRDDMEYHLLH